jgi:hypothetical protein
LAGRAAPLACGVALALSSLALGGCANEATVSSNLPLQRVVIYRNGVAYFERGGRVDDKEVRFKMKEGAVGDFLATLAVMERGGSSVQAAAFPIKSPEDIPECDPEPIPYQSARPHDHETPQVPRLRPCTDAERRHIKTVVLSLDGKEHDLQVGYVTEAPVWRPSYRLVVGKNGQAALQAWGIVQNLSGEDWKDIRLTLVAGAPVAFEAPLGTPVVPQRPIVTDEGEVMAVVPKSETSLAQREFKKQEPSASAPKPTAPMAEPAEDEEDDASLAESKESRGGGASRARGPVSKTASVTRPGGALKKDKAAEAAEHVRPQQGPMAPPPPPSPVTPSGPRSVRALAAVAASGGATRYDLPIPVTVPDKSATMVMLLAKAVPGDAAFLFAPDPSVSDSNSHPFRVVRFSNVSGGTLERGPIAVFDENAFLGQGMIDPLPTGATATVPFALDRSIAIERNVKYDELGERVQKIENGELTVERDSATQTRYRIRNGGDADAKVLVKHLRVSGARLKDAPQGTEDNVGTGSALVPYTVKPKMEGELLVDERTAVRRNEGWFTPVADAAIKALREDPKTDGTTRGVLTDAWKLRADIMTLTDTQRALQTEQNGYMVQTEETRRNIRAIEKNKLADKLRAELTKRLEDLARKTDEVSKKLVETQAKLAELNVRFRDKVRTVRYVAPVTENK